MVPDMIYIHISTASDSEEALRRMQRLVAHDLAEHLQRRLAPAQRAVLVRGDLVTAVYHRSISMWPYLTGNRQGG